MTKDDLDRREKALQNIILKAGSIALDQFRSSAPYDYEFKGCQDFITKADTLVEQYIRSALLKQFSSDAMLGEETGGSFDAENLWVVDPIDGTANFARGIEHFCISIAFVRNGKTELGGIFNPATEELYLARRNKFATKNGFPLSVSNINNTSHASFELGWSPRVSDDIYLNIVKAMLESGANVRRGASGALAIAWVAEGRTDGYAECHMNAWDCLAGLLLVREAGGRIGTFPTTVDEIKNGAPIIATAPGVAEALSAMTAIELEPIQRS